MLDRLNDNVKYFIFISATPNCSAFNCASVSKNGYKVHEFFLLQISSLLIVEVNPTRFLVTFSEVQIKKCRLEKVLSFF